ncbi:MAG: helix-turn-helix transcriptional regulator [Synechococcales bacterium]|nr:helix-turn-helix transcriptional regulator [Synechococcales bacterium]
MAIFVTSGNEQRARARLAQLLKELRGRKTQREFAKLLGTSYTALQDWEKQVRLPREENLKRIAQLKGWPEEELLHYLFHASANSESLPEDPLEAIMVQVQTLSLLQLEKLKDYLATRLNQIHQATVCRQGQEGDSKPQMLEPDR